MAKLCHWTSSLYQICVFYNQLRSWGFKDRSESWIFCILSCLLNILRELSQLLFDCLCFYAKIGCLLIYYVIFYWFFNIFDENWSDFYTLWIFVMILLIFITYCTIFITLMNYCWFLLFFLIFFIQFWELYWYFL